MKLFRYKGKLFAKCIPGKSLFHSTMVHEVVNRGDIFALDMFDGQLLTIIPGTAKVDWVDVTFSIQETVAEKIPTQAEEAEAALKAQQAKYRLKQLAFEMTNVLEGRFKS